MQKTLKSAVTFKGVGLHKGADVTLTVRPAAAEHGVWFKRTDVKDKDAMIAAHWANVRQLPLCTTLVNADDVSVATVEHLMAGLAGCGINNALIEVDGLEVPILDGSSVEYVQAFIKAGTVEQNAPVRTIEILKPIRVADGDAWATLEPHPEMQLDFEIDFPDQAIGKQTKSLAMANGAFVRELCNSRTFCRNSDVEHMRAQGLALGGTLDNAVVVDGAKVLSPSGLRHSDEPVRHKMLDALGDLALAGAPIRGRYVGHRAGHSLTNSLLRELFATPGAFRIVECDKGAAKRLPGAGIKPKDLLAFA